MTASVTLTGPFAAAPARMYTLRSVARRAAAFPCVQSH
jgi:hypothetical protein